MGWTDGRESAARPGIRNTLMACTRLRHDARPVSSLPKIAVFGGPTATICNTADLVTSNKARVRHGLPLLRGGDGQPLRHDILRPQRLAAPVTVFVEAHSAHPLEGDAHPLYSPPDGWLDDDGALHGNPVAGGRPVHVAELHPEDGLYLLPYMARQTDGSAWDATTAHDFAPPELSRQTFYPDPSRLYEEIDRFGLDDHGRRVKLFSVADFEFFRAAPSGGYMRGEPLASANVEEPGVDFFGYYPSHLSREPTLAALAQATNLVQEAVDSGQYIGVQWLEGSPNIEETLYWLGLLIDTTLPIVGHSAQRRNQTLSGDGPRNVVDGVKYLTSGVSIGADGKDRLGAVLIVDEMVYSSREVAKVDARPGGYETVGGHGGILADLGGYGRPRMTFEPVRRHTHSSDVRLSQLPDSVTGVGTDDDNVVTPVEVVTKVDGQLLPDALPKVTIHKYTRYVDEPSPFGQPVDISSEIELCARLEHNLEHNPLAGVVVEGMSPFGSASPTTDSALALMVFSGYPVVRVGRGNTGGMAYQHDPVFIIGDNLTSTKARILLMAVLLKFGALPPAVDPWHPTMEERARTIAAVARFQRIFDSH